jgi:divalent metal cation (Fe/Co/Zn/Cd) transporter
MDSVLGAALDVLMTVTGRFAVWLFSFGHWRGEPLGSEESRIYGAAGGLSYVREGKRVITHTGQLFAGIAFYVALVGLGILYAVAA